tara:strand:- start:2678 stop:3601 length:924 start_codon:yes stop_codon:yes gene_type:complete
VALSYDQISAITHRKFVPKLIDSVFDSDPILQRAKAKGWAGTQDGGTSVIYPLNYALATAAGWFQGAETLSNVDNDVMTGAEYNWKQRYVSIVVTRRDELINSGDSQIIDFVKSKTQIAEKTLADGLADAVYNAGTDSKAIAGLRSIVDNANTVGGIDQSAYSWWQSQEDSSTTTLTLSALQTMHTALSINNEGPTVILATRANYNRYYALLQPQQRFTDSETAKGGFSSLMFNGVPFIAGSKVPSSHVFMLNEKYLHLDAHKDENFRFSKFQEPNNQAVKVAKLYWMGVFGTDNARMHGKLTAIAA